MTARPPRVPELDPSCSMADEIAEALADARSVHTELGLRPYRVLSVRQHWSGGEVGRGDVTQVLTREFTPRPKVEFRTRSELTAGGLVERSTVILSELDHRLTEDEVRDLFYPVPLRPGDEAYIELFIDSRDGAAQRRRLVIAEPPERRAFDWRVVLREMKPARSRHGAPRYPGQRDQG